jgi:hypothetical protein
VGVVGVRWWPHCGDTASGAGGEVTDSGRRPNRRWSGETHGDRRCESRGELRHHVTLHALG